MDCSLAQGREVVAVCVEVSVGGKVATGERQQS